jgi:hypothetical protein
MSKYHKHEGVNDYHLITQNHKDPKTKKAHDAVIKGANKPAEKLKKLFSSKSTKPTARKESVRPEVKPVAKMVSATHEIDLTKHPEIEKLVVKFEDKNGKEATLSIPNYSK